MITPIVSAESSLTVYEVEKFTQSYRDALAQSTGLAIDLSGIEEMDGAGVQALLLAKRQATNMGQPFIVNAKSEVCTEVLSNLGLDGDFVAEGDEISTQVHDEENADE